ncbi:MAG: hypothetical protein J7J54_05100 [Candidatus Omnitrophica bacterium]|nr:hypothetical protein [Candidatus Omnitrophota bacterium]
MRIKCLTLSLPLLISSLLTSPLTWAWIITEEYSYSSSVLPPAESCSTSPPVSDKDSLSTNISSLLQPLELDPEEIDSIISLAEGLCDALSPSKNQSSEELDSPEVLILNFLQTCLDIGVSNYPMLSSLLQGLHEAVSTGRKLSGILERTIKTLQTFQEEIPIEISVECISTIIKYDPSLEFLLDDPELIAGVLPNKGEGYIKGLIQSLETLGFSSQEISCTLTDILPALYRKGITAPSGIIPFLQGLKETLESHYLTLRKDLIDPIAELIEAESTQNLNRVIDDLNQILNLMDTLIGSSKISEELFPFVANLAVEIYKQEQDINLTIQLLHNQIEYLLDTFHPSSPQLNPFLQTFSEMIKTGVSAQDCIDYINEAPLFFKYLNTSPYYGLTRSTFPLTTSISSFHRKLGMDFEEQWENIYKPLYEMMQSVDDDIERFLISRKYLAFIERALFVDGKTLNSIFNLLSHALKLRIFWPERFDYETLEYIVANRLETAQAYERNESPSYTGPLCIFLTAPRDWNGAFENIDQLLDEFRSHGYQVLYYEPWNLEDLLYAFAEATRPEEGVKASVVLFAGHGEPTSVDGYLSTELVGTLHEFGIGECLTDGGVIILDSCSTGWRGRYSYNIANALDELFPQAEHIFAPMEPAYPTQISFDPEHRVTEVRYTSSTYDASQKTVLDESS